MMYPDVLDGQQIAGVYVHEPGALLSNFAVAAVGWIIFVRTRNPSNDFSRNWRYFVLFIALGATGGMAVHGFPHVFSRAGFFLLWGVKNSCVPVANFFALAACVGFAPQKWRSALRAAIGIKAVATVVLLFATYSFLPAAADLGLTYAVLIGFTAAPRRTSLPAKWIFRAFLLAFLSGFAFVFKWDVDPVWFTHKDIVHVFAIISMLFIHKAIKTSKPQG